MDLSRISPHAHIMMHYTKLCIEFKLNARFLALVNASESSFEGLSFVCKDKIVPINFVLICLKIIFALDIAGFGFPSPPPVITRTPFLLLSLKSIFFRINLKTKKYCSRLAKLRSLP